MSLAAPETASKIVEACRSNLDAICQSYNANLGAKVKFEAGDQTDGCDAVLAKASDSPGLFVLFEFQDQALAVLISEGLNVPGWYRKPDENQSSRLQTLPMEWSMGIVPADLEASKFQTIACGNLKKQLTACGVAEDAHAFEYRVLNGSTSELMGAIHIVWPLNTPRFQNVADFASVTAPAAAVETQDNFETDESGLDDDSLDPRVIQRQTRVMPIPVSLIVKIAAKRIDLRQLRALSPGMLLTFDKSCDDPLDVFVGRQLYCRGEAVKMEEHFAIKITETDSEPIRPKYVHGL